MKNKKHNLNIACQNLLSYQDKTYKDKKLFIFINEKWPHKLTRSKFSYKKQISATIILRENFLTNKKNIQMRQITKLKNKNIDIVAI